jgi:uncharacterized cupin superfamily protein
MYSRTTGHAAGGAGKHHQVARKARIEPTEVGLVPVGDDGWFVLNAREGRWRIWEGVGTRMSFEGDTEFAQLGVNLLVLAPGEPIGMYHLEADQEDFLVVAGEALLIVEGVERPLRAWDFVHCPPGTPHMIVGAGDGPCVVIAVGAREHQDEAEAIRYTVDEAALRHRAGVRKETVDPPVAYAHLPERRWSAYREPWLPAD